MSIINAKTVIGLDVGKKYTPQSQLKLTYKVNFEIVFLWGHPIRLFWLAKVLRGHSNHIQKGVLFKTLSQVSSLNATQKLEALLEVPEAGRSTGTPARK